MQKLIFKSDKTNADIVLSFGLLMSTSTLPKEEQTQILLDQSNSNLDTLEKHFSKYPGDKVTLRTHLDLD